MHAVMAYTFGSSSIYISLFVSGQYTTVHIRQHLDGVDATTGKTQVNRDGLFLTTDDFASLMFQLKAIEKSFAEGGQETSLNETVVQNPNSVVSNVSLDVEHSGKRKIDFHDQSTLPVANKVKKVKIY